MKVFIIPSWYPSESHPYTGIFFRDQAELLAKYRKDWQICISLWGSHEPDLWIQKRRPLEALIKISGKPSVRFYERLLHPNCVEIFNPAYTWSRRFRKGNIQGIIEANEKNLERFTLHYGKPDVIHAHVSYPAGFVAQALAKKHGISYLITEHMGPFPFPSMRREMKSLILKPMADAANVLAVSAHLTVRIQSFGVPAVQFSNFIDDQFFVPKEFAASTFTFVYVGRLVPGKGLEVLLESLAKLPSEVKLTVVGDGPLERKLKQKARKLQLANIEWLGPCSREQVRAAIQQASALVLPSFHENQPVSILEALACGKPIVATVCGGSEELIHEGNGLTAKVGDALDLADKMRLLMHRHFDSAHIRADFLSKYGAEGVVDRLEAHFRAVLC